MKKELINKLFLKFESARYVYENVECWSARDIQKIFNYSEWRNFLKVIDKAKEACHNSAESIPDHFVDVNKMVILGSGSEREIDDLALTRYACYLVAQNGEPSKNEVAFAQTYFAVQTRKQEIIEKRLLDVARLNAREKLSKSEKKLSALIYERGVDHRGFALIRSKGDEVLFGGNSTQKMKLKLKIPENKPLADYLPTLTIKAKDFANELTSHNIEVKDLKGVASISTEHIENNKAVRKILLKRGIKPEDLPVDEDVQKVKRRLIGETKKVLESGKGYTKKKNKK
jgi:DNA-damage-inducible protein D